MSFSSWVSYRYFTVRLRPWTLSLLSWVALFGVTLSVAALLLIRSVMAGFELEVSQNILRFTAPILLYPKTHTPLPAETLTRLSSWFSAHPFLETEVIVHTQEDNTQGIGVKGVELSDPLLFEKLPIVWNEGASAADLLSGENALPGIVLGASLAEELKLLPFLGEEIDLVYPFGEVDPAGEVRPNIRKFRVIGSFKSGYYEYDHQFALVHLKEARRLIPATERVEGLSIWKVDWFQTEPLMQELTKEFGDQIQVVPWKQQHQKRFETLALQRFVMLLVLLLMALIACFNLLSLVMMLTASKTREIGILRAMGASRSQISRIFTQMGWQVGIIGSLAGGMFAVLLGFLAKKLIRLPAQYYLEQLPLKIEPIFWISVLVAAPALCFLATYYPARKVALASIAQSLREE